MLPIFYNLFMQHLPFFGFAFALAGFIFYFSGSVLLNVFRSKVVSGVSVEFPYKAVSFSLQFIGFLVLCGSCACLYLGGAFNNLF